MARSRNLIVPAFDFSPALLLPVQERMRQCVNRVRERLTKEGHWDIFGIPPVPDIGATPEELQAIEAKLGVQLPEEYRAFLGSWRYLILDDGLVVWGLDHEGVSVGRPWVSNKHRSGVRYLVFGYYWGYADGDQLLIDLDEPKYPVAVYLHEHGPLFESFAPSFSLALWRMVEEWAVQSARA
jgi:hypothetical protein